MIEQLSQSDINTLPRSLWVLILTGRLWTFQARQSSTSTHLVGALAQTTPKVYRLASPLVLFKYMALRFFTCLTFEDYLKEACSEEKDKPQGFQTLPSFYFMEIATLLLEQFVFLSFLR